MNGLFEIVYFPTKSLSIRMVMSAGTSPMVMSFDFLTLVSEASAHLRY